MSEIEPSDPQSDEAPTQYVSAASVEDLKTLL